MTHEDFIRFAIETAKQSEKDGGFALGVVLAKEGEVIARCSSSVAGSHDPSGHGEVNCIRRACQELGTGNLDGYALYSTLEPCSMCLACASWANLSEVYFGAYRIDVPENTYEQKDWSAEMSADKYTPWSGKPMKVMGGFLREECAELLKGYKDWHKKI